MRTRTGTARRWVVTAIAAATLGSACGAGTADAAVFRYSFTEGETRVYELRTVMDLETSPADAEASFTGRMSATMTMDVQEVQDDGTAVIEVTVADIEFELDEGEQPPIPDTTVATITIAPDGTITSVEGDFGTFGLPGKAGGAPLGDADPGDTTAQQLFFPQFPDEEIGPGDTWTETTEVPLGFGDTTVEVRVEGRHDGFEDTDYGRAARIASNVEVPMDLELPFGELLSGLSESFGQLGGQASLPPDFSEAKMVMSGTTTGETTSLVIPENADTVRVDGSMTLDQQITFEGFPTGPGAPPVQDVSVTGTIEIELERVS